MVRRKERLLRRKERLAGHVWLATCKQTSPNPPSSSFQLKWLLCCLRASPDTTALLLSPWEAVSLLAAPLLNGESWTPGSELRALSVALDPPGQQGHCCPLAAEPSTGRTGLSWEGLLPGGITAQAGLREQDTGRTRGC